MLYVQWECVNASTSSFSSNENNEQDTDSMEEFTTHLFTTTPFISLNTTQKPTYCEDEEVILNF